MYDLKCKRLAEEKKFTTAETLKIIKQIIDAVMFLNSKSLFHGDLKIPNILIANEKDLSIKLCDFDILRRFDESSIFHLIAGTYVCMAPEYFNGYGYGSKVDVFAFGVIVFYLLT